MTAVGSTTGNYYGALPVRAMARPRRPLSPSISTTCPKVLAIVLHYLTTAAHSYAGDRLRLTHDAAPRRRLEAAGFSFFLCGRFLAPTLRAWRLLSHLRHLLAGRLLRAGLRAGWLFARVGFFAGSSPELRETAFFFTGALAFASFRGGFDLLKLICIFVPLGSTKSLIETGLSPLFGSIVKDLGWTGPWPCPRA